MALAMAYSLTLNLTLAIERTSGPRNLVVTTMEHYAVSRQRLAPATKKYLCHIGSVHEESLLDA
jgi:hypothetical protein